MTTAPVVETSVTVNNSLIQDYVHPEDPTQPTCEMTPGFTPFTVEREIICKWQNCMSPTKHYAKRYKKKKTKMNFQKPSG